ncbi:hypothetical protein K443DRAFT_660775, partial [Laccaria amethystina LaAM-08-1]
HRPPPHALEAQLQHPHGHGTPWPPRQHPPTAAPEQAPARSNCHVADSNMATKRQTTTSLFIVSLHGSRYTTHRQR